MTSLLIAVGSFFLLGWLSGIFTAAYVLHKLTEDKKK